MTLQELYEKYREEHGCKERKNYADRAWCIECCQRAEESFYGKAIAASTVERAEERFYGKAIAASTVER
jgi:hypothetical protein